MPINSHQAQVDGAEAKAAEIGIGNAQRLRSASPCESLRTESPSPEET